MESQKAMTFGGVFLMLLLTCATTTSQPTTSIDCATVTALLSSCTTFITYGTPDPIPGSPCCDAMFSLNLAADSTDSRRFICRCLMSLITTYNPNATAIATLPGFCGVTLGFTVDPNTDCNYISMSGN